MDLVSFNSPNATFNSAVNINPEAIHPLKVFPQSHLFHME